MNPKDFKYILLDFDGTLMDTSEGIYKAFDHVCDHYGMERKGEAFYRRLIGPPLADSFTNAFGFPREKANEVIDVYREYYTPKGLYEVRVYDGLSEMLSCLRKAEKKIAVASSKPEKFIFELLDRFSLSEYFDFVGGSDMAETRVRKSDVIKYVLEGMGVEHKDECLMVGDRKFDVEGAIEAGVVPAGILWGFGSREELLEAGAAFVWETPEDVAVNVC